jgi:MoxR-like ATPase
VAGEDSGAVIIVRQAAQSVSSLLANRIRERAKPKPSSSLPPAPDRPAMRAAEALIAGQGPPPGESITDVAYGPLLIPDDLFAQIEDREEAKLIMLSALRSKHPVHVLLEGDPASGKSQLLQCVAGLPRARYAVGGMTSSSGMVDYLLERRSTSIVVIDELDKAETEDYAALYSLMESGTVPRLQHGKTEILHWRGQIFAACNSSAKMPAALVSRFVHVRLKPYTAEQVRHITETVVRREGLSPARAKAIAEQTAARSRDPRDGIQLGRLAGEDGELEPYLDQVVAKSGETG